MSSGSTSWLEFLATHRIIDLTVTIGEELPAWWPENNPYRAERIAWYEEPPYYNRLLHIEEHTGTLYSSAARSATNGRRNWGDHVGQSCY